MQEIVEERHSEFKFKMYIDYDKHEGIFYHNFFFEDNNFVLKIALTPSLLEIYQDDKFLKWGEEEMRSDLKYERFDLTKYVYLLYYG